MWNKFKWGMKVWITSIIVMIVFAGILSGSFVTLFYIHAAMVPFVGPLVSEVITGTVALSTIITASVVVVTWLNEM